MRTLQLFKKKEQMETNWYSIYDSQPYRRNAYGVHLPVQLGEKGLEVPKIDGLFST